METQLASKIQREALPLLDQAPQDRRIVVWGAGELGSWLMKELGPRGVAFVDGNPTKLGTVIADRLVRAVADLDSLDFDEVWVSVLSDAQSIRDSLVARGLVEGTDFRVPFPSGKSLQWREQLDRYLRFLAPHDLVDKELLEVGFGGQLYLALTLAHLGAARVHVCDVTPQLGTLRERRPEWLRWLRELAGVVPGSSEEPEALLDRIELHPVGVSAADLPFSTDSFDGVVNTGVMEHVNDPEGAFGEFARILRPGGLALCLAVGIHDHRANDPRSGFTPWSFLEVSDAEWSSLESNAYHQNRWRADDFRCAAERHGLHLLASETVHDPRLAQQDTVRFQPRFRDKYTLEQLAELDLFLAAQLPATGAA